MFQGNPNASIPTPQPVKQRPMFGAFGKSVGNNSIIFVSQVSESMQFHTNLCAGVADKQQSF